MSFDPYLFSPSHSPPGEEIESNRRHWIVAECPARLDLAGGWSDTPPLTLENKEGEGGGRVTNVAILIDQKRPIGAKGERSSTDGIKVVYLCDARSMMQYGVICAGWRPIICLFFLPVRRIDEPVVRICFSADGSAGFGDNLELSSLEEFRDFNQPTTPGALAKTAFIFTGVIQLPELVRLAEEKGTAGGEDGQGQSSLAEQLMQSIGSPGVELRCWYVRWPARERGGEKTLNTEGSRHCASIFCELLMLGLNILSYYPILASCV